MNSNKLFTAAAADLNGGFSVYACTHQHECNQRKSIHTKRFLLTRMLTRMQFHPMAKKRMHALKGLACSMRVAAASSPAATCKQGAAPHVACATRLRLRQAFSRTLWLQK